MNDNNVKELFDEPLTKAELELLAYKFKSYLGSVSREIINRQLEDIPYQGDNILTD